MKFKILIALFLTSFISAFSINYNSSALSENKNLTRSELFDATENTSENSSIVGNNSIQNNNDKIFIKNKTLLSNTPQNISIYNLIGNCIAYNVALPYSIANLHGVFIVKTASKSIKIQLP